MNNHKLGLYILRLSLAGVFLWFGFSQVTALSAWAGIVPDWATSFSGLSAERIVLGNAIFEIVLGSLLVLGLFVRIIAFVLALHLLVIALRFGLQDATGVRDLGLALSTLSLSLLYSKNRI